ncbi:MAG: hypothetical protein D6702_03525 [Planctomycetota bacterium]|nr:MAG: hypothetical protein D6702_03525 [Planctomycetota bacterium]
MLRPPGAAGKPGGLLGSDRVRFGLLLPLLTAALGCGDGRPPAAAVLITLDTTRADVLSCYGGPPGLTPALDALAAEGVRFTRARTVAPMTLPAHASMLTGLYPPRHTVRDNGHRALPAAARTLAEQARAAGLQTAAFVSASVLHSSFGLAQGFDSYSAPAETAAARTTQYRSRRAAEVVADAIAWLHRRDRSRGFLLWVHLWDPHAPYDPPPGFRRDNPYHGEVAAADHAAGELLAALRADPAWPAITVLAVADHGEAFGEHGEWTHGPFAWESTARVPLILRSPGLAPGTCERTVSVADVAPTLAEALGLPPLPDVDGRSLLNPQGLEPRGVWLESLEGWSVYGWAPLWGWVTDEAKLLDGGRPRLFDPVADPAEERDLAGERPELVAELRRALLTTAARPPLPPDPPGAGGPDEALLAAVAELGYAALAEDEETAAPPRPLAPTDRPDPLEPERAEELRLVNRGGNLAAAGRHAEAEALFARVVAANPENLWAQEMLGSLRLILGRPEEALPPLLRVARAGRGTATTFGNLAGCYRALGRDDRALPWLERAYARNPEHQGVRRHLIEVLENLGRKEEADRIRARD